MKNIYNSLIAIIIFLVPTNFFLKFFESSAYVNGLKVDYLIPKLYLSDIFILILIGFWGLSWLRGYLLSLAKYKTKINLKQKNLFTLTITLLIILITKQLTSDHPIAAVTYLVKIIELGLFTVFLHKNTKLIQQQIIEKSILFTLFFQSSVAIYQYLAQKSLFGYLLLGEPNLNSYIGISKSNLFGIEKILPYGTTAHPNVLGGFIAIYLLILVRKYKINYFKNFVIAISFTALILTQSVSAFLALILGIALTIYKKTIKPKTVAIIVATSFLMSLVLINNLAKIYPDNPSFVRRSYLNNAATKMISSNYLTGVGLNNFTAEVENYSSNREIVRFVQPTHNIFLLFFAENGLLGMGLVVFITYFIYHGNNNLNRNKKHLVIKNWSWIIILIPIALLDHYLITLQTGLLIFVFSRDL